MAVESVILGAIKRSIKIAGKKVASDIGTKQITDAQAILINRLKTSPNNALYEVTARELGIPVTEVRKIVKTFNQTSKMKSLSKGVEFRDLAQRKLKKELGVNSNDRIKDIINKAKESNARFKKISETTKNYNKDVKSVLTDINNELQEKIDGLQGAENKYKEKEDFNIDVLRFFDNKKEYGFDTLRALDVILKNLYLDLERYTVGSDSDVTLIEESSRKWSVYSKKAIQKYINDIYDDINIALNIKNKNSVKN